MIILQNTSEYVTEGFRQPKALKQITFMSFDGSGNPPRSLYTPIYFFLMHPRCQELGRLCCEYDGGGDDGKLTSGFNII